MNIAPQTTFNDLIDELNELRTRGVFVERSSFAWIRIKRECEKLCQADAALGWCALGMLYTTCGDVDEVERCFRNMERLGTTSHHRINWLASYMVLGLMCKAYELYKSLGKPEAGLFSETFDSAFAMGAFQLLQRNTEAMERMGGDMSALSTEIVKSAAGILAAAGLSDDDVVRHLDLAGEVLRERRIFDLDRPIVYAHADGFDVPGVTMVLFVKCSPAEVFAFNVALAEKEEFAGIVKSPAFDISFAAVK